MKSRPFLHSYEEAVDFIMGALPMFQNIGAAAMGKQDLAKITAFLDYLDRPHHNFRSVHIAGTNGKGSVSHMMAAIFQTNGYETGLFTSPHLKDYRERIRINGRMIEGDYILDWTNLHYEYLASAGLSFFEMSFGLACSYFSDKKIEVAVIETGLGGRLDATNIIRPLLSVITQIGKDHQEILGDTLEQIAWEKAGIIKSGVPVLLGHNLHPDLYGVFEKMAESREAPLFYARPAVLEFTGIEAGCRTYRLTEEPAHPVIRVRTLAPYQDHNINTAWYARKILCETGAMKLEKEKSLNGLKTFSETTGFRGRFEILNEHPLIIADTAHNTSALEFWQSVFENNNVHLHLILGMSRGRDIKEFLSLLPKEADYYFCTPDVPKGVPAEEVKEAAQALGLKGEVWKHPKEAMDWVLGNARTEDVCIIFGSIYLIAEIL